MNGQSADGKGLAPRPLQGHDNCNRKRYQEDQHQVFLKFRRFSDPHVSL